LPVAEPDTRAAELAGVIGCDPDEVIRVSAKTGEGIDELLERIVADVPPPVGDADAPLRALVVDSYFDAYRGVVCSIRVMDGTLASGDTAWFMATANRHEVAELGVLTPRAVPVPDLGPGESGYLITGVKEIDRIWVGDTVTHPAHR